MGWRWGSVVGMNKTDAANAGKAMATENEQLRRELHQIRRENERLADERDLARAAKDKLRERNEKLRGELETMTSKRNVAKDMLEQCQADLRKARGEV